MLCIINTVIYFLQLEAISPKQRTSKVQLALAQLYQRIGIDRCAATAYKEVLRYNTCTVLLILLYVN